MSKRSVDLSLLVFSTTVLIAGIIASVTDHKSQSELFWAIGGIVGLIPAISWLIQSFFEKQLGSDILAVLSLAGALLTKEMFAAAIISLMLATGRNLEHWAEGQAERQLKSLLQRLPRKAHRVASNGSLTEISADDIVVGDRLLVRSGEVVPAD
jgi:cation transport ATPase